MKQLFTILLFLSAGFYSCRKSPVKPAVKPNETITTPQATTGTLIGTVLPAGAVKTIRLSTIINGQPVNHSAVPNAEGKFTFQDLPAGTYTFVSEMNVDYIQDPQPPVAVVAGKDNFVKLVYRKGEYGTISGIISPAGAAILVNAYSTSPGSSTTSVRPDPITGRFTLAKVMAGEQNVYFTSASKFNTQPIRKVTVVSGQDADAGTFEFTRYGNISSLSFFLNDTKQSMTGTATYLGSKFSMTGRRTTGNLNNLNQRIYTLQIKLEQLTGPGTYICQGSSVSELSYSSGGAMSGGPLLSSSREGSSATVTITEIDRVAHTISGTFNATLVVTGPYTNVVTKNMISNGIFKTAYE